MKGGVTSNKTHLHLCRVLLILALIATSMIAFEHDVGLAVAQQQSAFLAWTTLTSMTTPRSSAAVVIANDHIYVVGGNTAYQSPTDSAEYAAINASGTLGSWTSTQSLIVARGGADGGPTAVEVNGYIYVIGGVNDDQGGGTPLNTVERASISPDGSLGAWQVLTATLNTGRRGAASVVVGDYLYVVGGASGPWGLSTLNSVERSRINPDASLGAWEVLTATMNSERGALGLAAYGGYLYALGGYLDTGMSLETLSSVEKAGISPDGTLGAWTSETPLTCGRLESSAVIVSNTLIVIGGWAYMNSSACPVETNEIGTGGTLGPWSVTSPASVDRPGVSAAVYNQSIYVVGGHADSFPSPPSTNAVERGALLKNKVFLPLVLRL